MSQLQLEAGQQYVDDSFVVIEKLRKEVHRLDEALRMERIKTVTVEHGVRKLKSATAPLYHALQLIHGEIDAMGFVDSAAHSQGNPKWEDWKRRMPGRPAEVIALLQVNSDMSVQNLMTAMKAGKNTVYQIMSRLGQAGVTKCTGGRYSLKD
jgi:hypothetical protein